jgi:hypothetical protein
MQKMRQLNRYPRLPGSVADLTAFRGQLLNVCLDRVKTKPPHVGGG